ncbi:hypothetical protein BCR33DRAFT_764157 [Rhizoclosmatium globosum]|uniref:Beta-galactosidase n=1 Tax=Rhizoclosmatium globosum TaxID=329046 RepID=A0A1Y2CLA1_9FUNG|nr:hypothetical protein BCR33DRAFT_764157 [Rhizoclosmatium globosum]|eukprot:ORY47773.1 hypothetical protein BCR33DRAFT_764157 [Rhizoclosmatium globosum]
MPPPQKKAPLPVISFAFDTSDSESESVVATSSTATATATETTALLCRQQTPPRTTRRSAKTLTRRFFAALLLVLITVAAVLVIEVRVNHSSPQTPSLPNPPLPPSQPPFINKTVSYNQRAVHVNGVPELLLVATIHYPRSDPSLWPLLLQRIKEAGNNAIDTYVFWNLHEPEEGVYDFENGEYTERIANLPLFLRYAHNAGLYVILRIGPYVCAEWNFGGFPFWLVNKPGMELRTLNQPFMAAMARFIEKTLHVVNDYLGTNGGPIILLQIENEYGNIANEMGPRGYKYIQWAGDYSQSLNVGLPWLMCRQDNVPTVLNAENGFYADNWIEGHRKRFPDQPAMVTELWTGWFQKFGQPRYTRYGEDLAYSAARFISKGGTYIGYYMWHGGTNFGRWGSDWKTASYDYDALLNEYGFPNNPKHAHVADFHRALNQFKDFLLQNDPVFVSLNSKKADAYVYGDLNTRALVFLSNDDPSADDTVQFDGKELTLPHWSVSLYIKDQNATRKPIFRLLPSCIPQHLLAPLDPSFQTPEFASRLRALSHLQRLSTRRSHPQQTDLILNAQPSNIFHIPEPIGISVSPSQTLNSTSPLEQIRATLDTTDYLWYTRRGIRVKNNKKVTLRLERVEDVAYVYFDGVKIHTGQITDVRAGLSANEGKTVARPVELEFEVTEEMVSNMKKKKGGKGDDKKKKKPEPFQRNQRRVRGEGDGIEHELAILVGVAGIWNYGAFMEKITKGILGPVKVDKVDISKDGEWVHQVGLKGEHLERSCKESSTPTELGWYLIKFPKSEVMALHEKALQTQLVAQTYNANPNLMSNVTPITSVILHLGSMTRGVAFVNGHAVGRHWNLTAVCEAAVPCKFPDSASTGGESCAVGCGYASQSWYNVPTAWIVESEFDDVEVVVFDEFGGDPLGVSLAVISG